MGAIARSSHFTSHVGLNNFILQVPLFVQKAVNKMYQCFKFIVKFFESKTEAASRHLMQSDSDDRQTALSAADEFERTLHLSLIHI